MPCKAKIIMFSYFCSSSAQNIPSPSFFSIIIFETKLLVHKAKNEINAHKNLVGLILDICKGQTKFILNTSNSFHIKIL